MKLGGHSDKITSPDGVSESKFEFRLSEEPFMRTNSGSHILVVPVMNLH